MTRKTNCDEDGVHHLEMTKNLGQGVLNTEHGDTLKYEMSNVITTLFLALSLSLLNLFYLSAIFFAPQLGYA